MNVTDRDQIERQIRDKLGQKVVQWSSMMAILSGVNVVWIVTRCMVENTGNKSTQKENKAN